MAIDIDFNAATRVANKLRGMARRSPRAADEQIKAHVKKMRRLMKAKPYPPTLKAAPPRWPRPQRYRRTGKLANSWATVKRRNGRYSLVNRALYSGYVVSQRKQAWMHKNPHRAIRKSRPWWLVEVEAAKHNKELTANTSKAILNEFK